MLSVITVGYGDLVDMGVRNFEEISACLFTSIRLSGFIGREGARLSDLLSREAPK